MKVKTTSLKTCSQAHLQSISDISKMKQVKSLFFLLSTQIGKKSFRFFCLNKKKCMI